MGSRDGAQLSLPNIPLAADVRVGDQLLTSGVGGRFPPGFPVGHVVDMISMPWMLPAIFNVADMSINAAAALILFQAFRGVHIDGTRDSRDNRPGGPGEDDQSREPTQ